MGGHAGQLFPGQCTARLVLNDSGFEEVAFFLQIDHLAHPGEWVLFVGEQGLQADLCSASIGNVAQVAFEHGGKFVGYSGLYWKYHRNT